MEKKTKREGKKKLKEELNQAPGPAHKVVKIQIYYLVSFKLWFHHLW